MTDQQPATMAAEVPVRLADCPPGLFSFRGAIGFKTEYRGMDTVGPTDVPGSQIRWAVGRHSEVYVVESGEAFWGGTSRKDDREELMVTPISVASASALPTDAQVREAMQTAWDDFCDDAQAKPDDIYREGRKTYFRAGTWADHTAMQLRSILAAADGVCATSQDTKDARAALFHLEVFAEGEDVKRLRVVIGALARLSSIEDAAKQVLNDIDDCRSANRSVAALRAILNDGRVWA